MINQDLTLVGRKITGVWISDEYLSFETDAGWLTFGVEGDCCSTSYFHDFYGARKLYDNGPVTAFEAIELNPGDPGYCAEDAGSDELTQVYGYRLTTEHPQFGPQSTVFAFRNESNGYYGGDMYGPSTSPPEENQVRIEDDWIGD